MQLDEKSNIMTQIKKGNVSAYLTDIFEKPGIHTIKFKPLPVERDDWFQTYGIWKVDAYNDHPVNLDFATNGPRSVAINNK